MKAEQKALQDWLMLVQASTRYSAQSNERVDPVALGLGDGTRLDGDGNGTNYGIRALQAVGGLRAIGMQDERGLEALKRLFLKFIVLVVWTA